MKHLVKKLGIAAVVAISVLQSTTAFSTQIELIVNGDFESGNLTGWTSNMTGGGSGNNFYVIQNGNAVPVSGHGTQPLVNGNGYVAVSDQSGPGGEELRQSFTVTSDITSLILSFDWFDNTHNPYSGNRIDGSNQSGRVDILTSGAPALDVGAGVVRNLLLNAGTYTSYGTTIPWSHFSFDLSDLSVGTYDLRFGNGQCCYYQELGVDNVSLVATSVPEPASLALVGLGLAGLAVARRRKTQE